MPEPPGDDPLSPVRVIPTDVAGEAPSSGIALCLSGGGYRAMLFHLGALWRLNELGFLPKLARISSVSGGSITAGVLGLHWRNLAFDQAGVAEAFVAELVEPVRAMARVSIDVRSVLRGLFWFGGVARQLERQYRRYLFGEATLQDLPDEPPRFVINATNVQSGALWRFAKPYMWDWRVGKVSRPTTSLAFAVAASSAFPPALSPARLRLQQTDVEPHTGADLERPPYTTEVFLTDGGVYDNLGLETAWKRCDTILVSDAGGRMEAEPRPHGDWVRHALRVGDLIDNQVRSLRKRQLVAAYRAGSRKGAYWGIRSEMANYPASSVLRCPPAETIPLADLATRLEAIDETVQEQLINWGYAICDVAMRAHMGAPNTPPSRFPYIQGPV